MPGSAQPAAGTATAGPSGAATPRTASYAGAVKTAPTDWHLQFSVNGKDVAMSDTLYGVVHRAYASAPSGASASTYNLPVVVVNWRKVPGPAPTGEPICR